MGKSCAIRRLERQRGLSQSDEIIFDNRRVLVRLSVVEATDLPIAGNEKDYFSGLINDRTPNTLSSVSQQVMYVCPNLGHGAGCLIANVSLFSCITGPVSIYVQASS